MNGDTDKMHSSILVAARHDPQFALVMADEIVAEHGDESISWFARAYVNTVLKQHLEARKDIERAIEIEPGQSQGYFKLGRNNLKVGLFQNAVSSFSKIIDDIELQSREAFLSEAQIHRAFCRIRLGEFQSALQDLVSVEVHEPIFIDKLRTRDELIQMCRQESGGSER